METIVQFDRESLSKKLDRKTEASKINRLSSRIGQSPVDKVSGEAFLSKVMHGQTFIQSVVDGYRDTAHYKESHMIVLDFDNKECDIDLLSNVLLNPFTKDNAFVWYESFSSTVEQPRMRVVFALSEPITDVFTFKRAYAWVASHYEQQVDISVDDPVKFIYGTNGAIQQGRVIGQTLLVTEEMKQYPHTLHDMVSTEPVAQVQRPVSGLYNLNKHLLAILEGDYEGLRELIATDCPEALQFTYAEENSMTLDDRLDTIDMAAFLGLPESGYFKDIFSPDETPSAHIIRLERVVDEDGKVTYVKGSENGLQVYKSFSSQGSKGMNLIHIVRKINPQLSLNEAIDFISKVTGFKIQTKFQLDCERTLNLNYNYIFGSHGRLLYDDFPELVKTLRKHKTWNFYENMFRIAGEVLPAFPMKKDGHGIVFLIDYSKIRESLMNRGITGKSLTSIRNKLSDLTELGLIKKLTLKDIHPRLASLLMAQMRYTGHTRHTGIYQLRMLMATDLDPLKQRLDDYENKAWSVRSNMVATAQGIDKQKEQFPQMQEANLKPNKREWEILKQIIDKSKVVPINDLTLEYQKKHNRRCKDRLRKQKKEASKLSLYPVKTVSPHAKQRVHELLMAFALPNGYSSGILTKKNKPYIEKEVGCEINSNYYRKSIVYKVS